MKNETIALHGGFDADPTTKAVAVPIYQTVAYSFDSAEHGCLIWKPKAIATPGSAIQRTLCWSNGSRCSRAVSTR